MHPQLVENILESARDAIIIVRNNGYIESCNRSASTTFGYEPKLLVGQHIKTFVPNFDDIQHNLTMTHTPIETHGIRNTGLDFPIEINASLLKSNELIILVIRDITEKKIASHCYLQKTSEFQSLFEVLHACLLRLDPNEIVLDYHIGQITDFCAKTPPVLGGRLSELFEPCTAQRFHESFQSVQTTGEVQHFEYTLPKHDHKSTFLVTIKPFLQEQMIAIIQDITDYKNAEKSILNYHTLADILPIGIFRCTLAGEYIYQNEFWMELTGQPHTDQPALWFNAVHPDDKKRIQANWTHISGTNVPFNAEFRFLKSDGQTVYVQCRAVPELNGNEQPRGYIGIAHNITENILANSEIQKSWVELETKVEEHSADLRIKDRWLQQSITEKKQIEETLSEEQNFSSAVIDTTAAVIMVCDPQGRIVRLNQSLIALSGYTEYEIKEKFFYDYLVVDEEIAHTRSLFEELKQHQQQIDYESYCKTKHGPHKLIAWSNTVIVNESGHVDYVVFTGIDITEQHQAEEEARQHHADLVHVSRLCTMGEMAAGLAHELNQPLAAIMNYTQGCVRLLNQTENAQKHDLAHALRQVSSQAQRAAEIIRKLRNLVDKSDPQRSVIQLEKVARNAIKFASADIKKHAATVRFRTAENLPQTDADAIQIEQVLLNLIRNGLEAMHSTSLEQKELIVRVFLNENNHLQVSVSDQGEGLPIDFDENKVFDTFYTTKSDGMGMGLAISRSIIEAHDGQMWVTRNEQNGSTFHFSLPSS